MEAYQDKSTPELTMTRYFPMTWTAIELAVASAATWLLCSTGAIGDASALFIH
jgi:hypothetical protein